MEYFVEESSIVRKIWSDTDVILFIFGASAGEFALHKTVDWLFYTGKLPNDPIGRLFSTVTYAQKIIFEEKNKAEKTLLAMKQIHTNVEKKRGKAIPNWAYQDVLFMLIDYSITAQELLNHALSKAEREAIYTIFKKVGQHMGIDNLPENYDEWQTARGLHLESNYQNSDLSKALFKAYKQHLGFLRYTILIELQKILLPKVLNKLLFVRRQSNLRLILKIYSKTKKSWFIKNLKFHLLPKQYRLPLRQIARINS